MIVRQLSVRQSCQFLALTRRASVASRFLSTETPVETAVQTPSDESTARLENSPNAVMQASTPEAQGSLQQAPPNTSTARPENPLNEVMQASKEAQGSMQQAWRRREARRRKFNKMGTEISDAYEPEEIVRNPPMPSDITLELLLASGTHLGHSTSRWNPQNSRYIFGIREGVHIISLDVTAAYLRRAAKVVEEVAARGGLILFVGTRKGQKRAIVKAAELAKGYHIFERWIPGSLTNGPQILGHCETKVVNALDEELSQFKSDLADRPSLKPDLVVCLNPLENAVLLHECGLNNVPTIAIIDTDADASRVTYPIPANDDSLRATSLIAGILGRAGQVGQERRLQKAHEGNTTYETISEEELRMDPFTGEKPHSGQQKS